MTDFQQKKKSQFWVFLKLWRSWLVHSKMSSLKYSLKLEISGSLTIRLCACLEGSVINWHPSALVFCHVSGFKLCYLTQKGRFRYVFFFFFLPGLFQTCYVLVFCYFCRCHGCSGGSSSFLGWSLADQSCLVYSWNRRRALNCSHVCSKWEISEYGRTTWDRLWLRSCLFDW